MLVSFAITLQCDFVIIQDNVTNIGTLNIYYELKWNIKGITIKLKSLITILIIICSNF